MHNILNDLKAFQPMANHVIDKKTSLPILTNIAVANGRMVATDLNHWIEMPIDFDGVFTMPLGMLNSLINCKPDGIRVGSIEDNNITLSIDDPQILKYPGKNLNDFPNRPEGRFRKIGKWDSEMVNYLVELIPFLSTDELKPSLTGINYVQADGEVNLCGTDGHRMRRVKGIPVKSQKAFDGIVSSKAITFLSRFGKDGIDVSASDKHTRFGLGNTVFYSRIIDEKYPEIDSVFPRESKGIFSIERNQLLKLLKNAAPFVCCLTHKITLLIKPNSNFGKLQSEDIETQIEWETDIPFIEHTGEGIEIGYNRKYLESMLKLSGDIVTFTYDTPVHATVIWGDDPRVNMLLMPIRINA